MRVAFFGTPGFAVPTLDALAISGHEVVMVVSRPDRPKGRGRSLMPTPVKEQAASLGLPLFQPARLDDDALIRLRECRPDVGVLVAYGLLLPKSLLDLPRHGFVNVHPSLVPRHRGAAPIERALLEGDQTTGVSILAMGEGLDDGPIYAQEAFGIPSGEDAGSLRDRCALLGARMMVETIDALEAGDVELSPQAETGMTYADKLTAEEEWILWGEAAERTINRVRALGPRPGASTGYHGKRLKVLVAERVSGGSAINIQSDADPGVIIEVEKDGITVSTGSEAIRILRVQPEGKTPMSGAEFVRGYRPTVGEVFARV